MSALSTVAPATPPIYRIVETTPPAIPDCSRPTVLIDAAWAGGDVMPTPSPMSSIPGMTSVGAFTDSKSANQYIPASATSDPISVCARAEPLGQPPANHRADHHRQCEREQRLSHRTGAETAHAVEEDRQLKEQRIHRHVLEGNDRGAAEERAACQQREVDDRRGGAALPDGKEAEEDDAKAAEPPRGGAPGDLERHDRQRKARCEQRAAGPVEGRAGF